MEQPKGYVSKDYPDYVCRLKKSIYGLRQSSRSWYGKVAQYLLFCGFRASEADSSLFVKIKSNVHLIVLVYVDDMIITGNNGDEVAMLINELSVRFELKNLGEASRFLGLEVEKSANGYFISQRAYVKDLLRRFNMEESKEKAIPMEQGLKLTSSGGVPLNDATPFRQLHPTYQHWDAAKRILRYIKGTLNYGLMYRKCEKIQLVGYTDADWAGSVEDRHSTTGYCFSMGSSMVSWCSKKQPVVALSSTEAEYVAASIAALECVWLKGLIRSMLGEFNYDVQFKCDNESAVKLSLGVVDRKFALRRGIKNN
nr:PREDICTED: uncharacterized mitochondrial protein AtMg00810-like [Daucus carota subsp. sativus]